MPKISHKAAMMFAAIAGGLMVLPATQASANCVSYAKLSLQQLQDNTRKNCALTGPEWQADVLNMKTLLAWCGKKSPQEAQDMLKQRKAALSTCQPQ